MGSFWAQIIETLFYPQVVTNSLRSKGHSVPHSRTLSRTEIPNVQVLDFVDIIITLNYKIIILRETLCIFGLVSPDLVPGTTRCLMPCESDN